MSYKPVQIDQILKALMENPEKEFTYHFFNDLKASDKLSKLFKQGFVERREGHKETAFIYFYRIKREEK